MFVSEASKDFMTKNGITHVTSAPYHPSSNGLAERAVQTFKDLMKKVRETRWRPSYIELCLIIVSHPSLQLDCLLLNC